MNELSMTYAMGKRPTGVALRAVGQAPSNKGHGPAMADRSLSPQDAELLERAIAPAWLLKKAYPRFEAFHLAVSGVGSSYDVPVVYHRGEDGVLEAITSRRGVWWRNLRGGADITVLLRGRDCRACVEVVEDDLDTIGVDKRCVAFALGHAGTSRLDVLDVRDVAHHRRLR